MDKEVDLIPYTPLGIAEEDMLQRSAAFFKEMNARRTVRKFSDIPVDKKVIENVIMTASTAPSGAHKQPWTFCAVGDPGMKRRIREAAEKEEYENYNGRMTDEWLDDLKKFRTDWRKPYLETTPWLIVVFRRIYEMENGEKKKSYYVSESVGIATGFLLAAIHHAGLVALTHTPSPMNFLAQVLDRPDNEKPYLLIPVGYPAEDTQVPDLARKCANDVIAWY